MLLVIYSPKILSPNSEKYLESYNSDPPVVIRFLTYFHLLGSRIQDILNRTDIAIRMSGNRD